MMTRRRAHCYPKCAAQRIVLHLTIQCDQSIHSHVRVSNLSDLLLWSARRDAFFLWETGTALTVRILGYNVHETIYISLVLTVIGDPLFLQTLSTRAVLNADCCLVDKDLSLASYVVGFSIFDS